MPHLYMASLAMHVAIANEYCKKNPTVNYKDFLRGSLQPDLVADKNKSHYTITSKTQDVDEVAKNKIGLTEYVKNNTINNDFELGMFLHMVTDYLYYYEYLVKAFKKANLTDLHQAIKAINDDFIRTNGFFVKHYGVDLTQLPENCRDISDEQPILMTFEEIKKFVEYCAGIHLLKFFQSLQNT